MAIIAYYRVSTTKQGISGLGLDGQRAAVETYANQQQTTIAASFTEVESGSKHHNRPQLAVALKAAKALRATLVVAKLDRLARNVAFLSALMESGEPFVACDNPNATKLTLHILAAVAEDELDRISSRLKAAFAAGRARGRVYGSRLPGCKPFTAETQKMGCNAARIVNVKLAAEFRMVMQPIAIEQRKQGKSNMEVACDLNKAGYTTRRGKPWTLFTVSNLLNS